MTSPGEPEAVARGRYALYANADGSVAIARTDGLCGTCAGCGCGEQMPPISIPAVVAAQARRFAEGKLKIPGALGKVARARR